MNLNIPTTLADAATAHGVDPETVALAAIADAIETAAIAATNEATNTARRVALDGVAADLATTRARLRTVAEVEPVPAPDPHPMSAA